MSQQPYDSNKIALTIDPTSNIDSLLLHQPMPQNKIQARQVRKAQHHFWIEKAQMGFSDMLHCWCGAMIPLHYVRDDMSLMRSMDTMAEQVQAFGREHQACEPLQREDMGMQSERDTGGYDA